MAILVINGISMPAPSEFTPKRIDLSSEETGRTLSGIMIKDVVAIKVTLSCSWKLLNWADCSKLLTEVEKSEFMSVKYPDPKEGIYVTKTFYVGDRTAPALKLEEGKEMWEGVAFDFIEQ